MSTKQFTSNNWLMDKEAQLLNTDAGEMYLESHDYMLNGYNGEIFLNKKARTLFGIKYRKRSRGRLASMGEALDRMVGLFGK